MVSADRRYVFMELDPEVTTVRLVDFPFITFAGAAGDGGAVGEALENIIQLPVEDSQTVDTTIGVPDKGTIIVGGLGRSERSHSEGGLPVVSKIPILRRIFGSESADLSENSLFIVARPEIVILREQEERFGATPSDMGGTETITIE